jgi:hypothetical protein
MSRLLKEDTASPPSSAGKRLPHVQKKIRIQLLIFAVIFLIITILEIDRIIRQDLAVIPILVGFLVGLGIGIGLARTKVLGWDPEDGQVVGAMDLVGGLILVLYIVFVLIRDNLIERWISDPAMVGTIGLAVTGGVMVSRVVFTRKGIRTTLEAAGVLTSRKPV